MPLDSVPVGWSSVRSGIPRSALDAGGGSTYGGEEKESRRLQESGKIELARILTAKRRTVHLRLLRVRLLAIRR
jgi:hypothetical protein